MNFYKKLILFGLLFGSYESGAQINGRVIDNSKNAISFCNVLLTKTSDSTIVTGATTDTSGNFQLEIKDTGSFRIVVAYIGYRKFYSHPFSITKGTLHFNAGNISLESDTKVLKEVSVVAEKPFIQHKVDRMVFNIENSIISAGNNAMEVLNKLPGVTVDNNDAIQVRGKPGVLIMIDGRTSYMSAADVANYLRSLDASQIEKIEVITNPSAKYDASGNAVINIVLKKDKNLGFNGQLNASYGQGFYSTSTCGLNANYRTKKLNFFGSYNNNRLKRYNVLEQQNIFSESGEPVNIFVTRMRNVYKAHTHGGKIGMDFTPNDKQTIGLVAEGFSHVGTLYINGNTGMYNGQSVLDSSLYMKGVRNVRRDNMTYDLNYRFKTDSTGKELSANANYSTFFNAYNEEDITNYYNNNNQYLHAPTTLNYNLPAQINIGAAKIDYAQPIGEKNKLESGLKSSIVNTDNNAQYWNVLNGVNVPDSTKTNHFIYSENINAAYLNFTRKSGEQLDTQFGLRAEETQSKGIQTINDSTVKRNYIQLFPSVFISWKIDSNHTVNFSYTRRVERPDYRSLNPFRFYANPYLYFIGNPYLQPQLSDNFEFTHVFKSFLSTSIGYLHMTDVIANINFQDYSTHLNYSSAQNLNTYNVYNILVSATLHPAKWWTSINSVNILHDHYFGSVSIQNGYYSNSNIMGVFNTLNSFSFKNNWSMEIRIFYRTANLHVLTIEEPIYTLAAGIKKRFANGKGTISLNCQDVLWSERFIATQIFQNVDYRSTFYHDSRRVNLSLSWKLGKSQYQREEKQKSAAEEINRVQ